MRTLQLGCGRRSRRSPDDITLDADPSVAPDVVCRLGIDSLPFADDSIDHASAIHVLEHIGRQGETGEWFQFWEELYRVLAPNGTLIVESPLFSSVWAWADPTHTRALSPEAFAFFNQDAYRLEGSSISPYRIRCDFTPIGSMTLIPDDRGGSHFRGMLCARKPLLPWWEMLA